MLEVRIRSAAVVAVLRGATYRAMPTRHVYRPGERPAVEVLVDAVWCDGELRMRTQRDDGSWKGNVQWRSNGEPTRRLDTFVADFIRPA
jgi:hypothetical protein